MTDLLSSLEPYYKDGVQVGDEEKVKALHDFFCRDFFTDGVFLDGERINVKPYWYSSSHKDNLPEWYETYKEKFGLTCKIPCIVCARRHLRFARRDFVA